jgi:hypothetical protein
LVGYLEVVSLRDGRSGRGIRILGGGCRVGYGGSGGGGCSLRDKQKVGQLVVPLNGEMIQNPCTAKTQS